MRGKFYLKAEVAICLQRQNSVFPLFGLGLGLGIEFGIGLGFWLGLGLGLFWHLRQNSR